MKRMLLVTLTCGLASTLPLAFVIAQDFGGSKDRLANRSQAQRPSDAQTNQGWPNSSRGEVETRQPTDQQQDSAPRASAERRGVTEGPARRALDSWVTIYADFDHDGRIDSKERIYVLDLMRARRDSDQRRMAAHRQGRFQQESNRSEPLIQLQGTIEDQAEFSLRGHGDDKFLLAHINTENGKTARVVLGRREDLKSLDLSQGQSVTVRGERHQINNKPVLFARTAIANGQTVNVSPPKSGGEQRVRGTIESLDRRRFRDRDGEFLVAYVDLVSGRTRMINLGSLAKLKSLNLQEGDEIRVLARPGRINDQPALVAAEVNANGQTVAIPRPEPQSPKRRSTDSRSGRSSRQVDRRQDADATRNR